MNTQKAYNLISKVIVWLNHRKDKNIRIADLCRKCDVSQDELEEILAEWAGLTVQEFLYFISPVHNLQLIHSDEQLSLFDEKHLPHTQIPSPVVEIIPMSVDVDENRAERLNINYEFYKSPFGELTVASSSEGVCYIAFDEDETKAIRNMKSRFSHAVFSRQKDDFQAAAVAVFELKHRHLVRLHMKGTDFQLLVWNQLLKIPFGELRTYQQLADELNLPTASRAVGTAIGRNPIAYIVPCHRVVQSTGNFGDYMWGSGRKMAIVAWEMGRFRYSKPNF